MSLDKTLFTLRDGLKIFMETGSILDPKRSGRPSIDEETIDAVCVAFHHSPKKSIRVASNELAIPRSTVNINLARNTKFRKKALFVQNAFSINVDFGLKKRCL